MKKSLIQIIKILGLGLSVLYPFVVFFALKRHVAFRILALFLVLSAGFLFARRKNLWLFICVLLCGVGLIVFNNDAFLKMYPVLMNLGVFFMFALSLKNTPLMEQFAIKMGQDLDDNRQKYARRATFVWAIFMFCLTTISLITVFLSNEVWMLFNGLISYVLIAIMMCVEFVVRKKVTNVHKDK